MAVNTTATQVIYTEDGSTLTFPFTTFTVFAVTDLVVTSIITATGVQTLLVLNTDYTVSLNADGTGNVVKSAALNNTNELVLQRVLPLTQGIVLVNNEGTDAATFEEGYDRLTMIAQQLQSQINRSVLQPITASTPIAFPTPVASTYIGFDASGNMTTLTSVSTVTMPPVSPTVALELPQVNAGGTNFQYVTIASLLLTALPLLTTASLVSGKVLFQLANIPAGAGVIPAANLPTAGLVPVGGIVMWSGTIATIPANWALCNGSNGTPDLRNKFVVCANADAAGVAKSTIQGAAAQSGGEATHQLTIAELAAHTHNYYDPNTADSTSGTPEASGGRNPFVAATTSTGGDQPHNNVPPFYALAFIQRTA